MQELQVELLVTARLCLVNLRQIERAVHFMEGRQDAASALPSDVLRQHHNQTVVYRAAWQEDDQEGMQAARQAFQDRLRDDLSVAARGGCFSWLARLSWQLCCLRLR